MHDLTAIRDATSRQFQRSVRPILTMVRINHLYAAEPWLALVRGGSRSAARCDPHLAPNAPAPNNDAALCCFLDALAREIFLLLCDVFRIAAAINRGLETQIQRAS